MLRIDGLKLPPEASEEELRTKVAAFLRISPRELLSFSIYRRSIDAREQVCCVYSVLVSVKQEEQLLRRCKSKQLSLVVDTPYQLPPKVLRPTLPPVVIGAGPAGLFAALTLALCGAPPILLERGKAVEERQADVEAFWQSGKLNPHSNVQFGEGGAGAFSDGKLNTGTKDPRHRWVLEQWVACGAPQRILIDSQPHIGTDYLHISLQALRQKLLDLGCEIRFSHQMVGLEQTDGKLTALQVQSPTGQYRLPCEQAILALGHSARDTFAMLHEAGLPMEQKAFSIGVRIEHKQSAVNAVQYRRAKDLTVLPAANYKLSCHLPNERAVYSFCVCPGGQVVAAASEEGRLVTNGMSHYARDLENINGGLLVSVTPADYGSAHPLAGIAFQRKCEEAAFRLGGGDYTAPAQRVEDFLQNRPSTACGTITPSYRPRVRYTDLRACLPDFVTESLQQALPLLGQKLDGFDAPDAILTAIETRSSSPVRILRDKNGQSSLRGLYPCGEGAGYAGGILSAATDGIKIAEHLLHSMEVAYE